MKLVDGIVDVLYSSQRANTKITSRSTTTMSNTTWTTARTKMRKQKRKQKELEARIQKPRRDRWRTSLVDAQWTMMLTTWRRQKKLVELRTVNEDEDFIVFHNDLVEHGADDGMDEKNQAQSKGTESSSTETTSAVAVWLQERQVKNIPIEAQQKWKQIAFTTLGSHTWSLRQVLSCYMSATAWTKLKKDDEDSEDCEEEGETAAARETEVAEIRRIIELWRSTPKEEKQRMKELSECIKKCFRDKKRLKRQQVIHIILEDFKGVSNIPGIKSAKKKVLITKIKNERGEIITSRKGIAHVFGEFYKIIRRQWARRIWTRNQRKWEMKAALICTSTTPMKWWESQRSRLKSCQDAINKLKKGKSPDSEGIRAEDSQSMRWWNKRNGETDFQRKS